MEKNIKNIISDSLKINGGEYKEIRIEENNSTRITYRGDSRENISINSGIGGCARVYSNGGWDLVVLMIYISQKIKWQKQFLYLNLTVASQ